MEPIVKLSLGDSTCHLRQTLREALVKPPEVCILLFVYFFFMFTNNEVLSKTEALLGFFAVKRVNSLVSVATQYSSWCDSCRRNLSFPEPS